MLPGHEVREARDILITGGTGYIGGRLIPSLLSRGHRVRVLARTSSIQRVPAGATGVVGDALDEESVEAALRPGETLVHLVGTPHPGPAKAKEFVRVDLVSIHATVAAAQRVPAAHVVYISVAQPAPVMQAYLAVRAEGERALAEAKITASVLRPWYVLGPGHRWAIVLAPLYAVAELVPALRPGARRLGLVTLNQMVAALVRAVENPPPTATIRIVDVPAIRGR